MAGKDVLLAEIMSEGDVPRSRSGGAMPSNQSGATRAIAADAYLYAYPLLYNHKTLFQQTMDPSFRVHKSGLAIRPVWHQKEHRVQAHILVCFLTYVLWKTLAASCRQAGLGDEPRRVFQALSEIAMVDVVLPTRSGTPIRKRCVSHPLNISKS